MYTENPVSGENPVNQESQALWSLVGGTWNLKLIKMIIIIIIIIIIIVIIIIIIIII